MVSRIALVTAMPGTRSMRTPIDRRVGVRRQAQGARGEAEQGGCGARDEVGEEVGHLPPGHGGGEARHEGPGGRGDEGVVPGSAEEEGEEARPDGGGGRRGDGRPRARRRSIRSELGRGRVVVLAVPPTSSRARASTRATRSRCMDAPLDPAHDRVYPAVDAGEGDRDARRRRVALGLRPAEGRREGYRRLLGAVGLAPALEEESRGVGREQEEASSGLTVPLCFVHVPFLAAERSLCDG